MTILFVCKVRHNGAYIKEQIDKNRRFAPFTCIRWYQRPFLCRREGVVRVRLWRSFPSEASIVRGWEGKAATVQLEQPTASAPRQSSAGSPVTKVTKIDRLINWLLNWLKDRFVRILLRSTKFYVVLKLLNIFLKKITTGNLRGP